MTLYFTTLPYHESVACYQETPPTLKHKYCLLYDLHRLCLWEVISGFCSVCSWRGILTAEGWQSRLSELFCTFSLIFTFKVYNWVEPNTETVPYIIEEDIYKSQTLGLVWKQHEEQPKHNNCFFLFLSALSAPIIIFIHQNRKYSTLCTVNLFEV